MNSTNIPFVFWGTPEFAVGILDQLKQHDLVPELIVTAPNKPRGRGQHVSLPPVGQWAKNNEVPILQPKEVTSELINQLKQLAPVGGWPLFVVIAYGHILPAEIIHLPNHNTLNVHPSLLPKLRGPAPIREAILQEDSTGTSIIELDEKMDHGPIIAQEIVDVSNWPPTYEDLKDELVIKSGQLLAQTIPDWVNGKITPQPQEHDKATYSRKFSSKDGEIDLSDDPKTNLRKIRAFTDWPKAHFYADGKRVLITKAHLDNGELVIDTVKPDGGDEVPYDVFTS